MLFSCGQLYLIGFHLKLFFVLELVVDTIITLFTFCLLSFVYKHALVVSIISNMCSCECVIVFEYSRKDVSITQEVSIKLHTPLSSCGCHHSESCLYEYWEIFLKCCVNSHQLNFKSGLWACCTVKGHLSLKLTKGGLYIMDHHDLQELRRILRTDEEMVQDNKASIFSLISKFYEYEQQCVSQIAKFMSTLVRDKQQLAILEEDCNFLKNLVENLNRDAKFVASNQ